MGFLACGVWAYRNKAKARSVLNGVLRQQKASFASLALVSPLASLAFDLGQKRDSSNPSTCHLKQIKNLINHSLDYIMESNMCLPYPNLAKLNSIRSPRPRDPDPLPGDAELPSRHYRNTVQHSALSDGLLTRATNVNFSFPCLLIPFSLYPMFSCGKHASRRPTL